MDAASPRPLPQSVFDWLDRLPRPLLLGSGVLLVAAYLLAVVTAAWISALSGRNPPDMSVGMAPMIVGMTPFVIQLLCRHREVRDGFRNAEPPPVVINMQPSAPESDGVNPHGGPGDPS